MNAVSGSSPGNLSSLGRVSVVGGSGFLGLNLCRFLCDAGLKVVAVDPRPLNPGAIADRPVEHLPGISKEAFAGSSVVFHAAGSSEPASSNTHLQEDLEGTVGLTLDVIAAAEQAGVSRIVHVSSGGTVYGPDADVPTPEDSMTEPVCAYGISKLAAEGHVQLAERMHGMCGINLRVSNPYGPWQDPRRGQGVVNAFIHRGMCHEPIDLWGDGGIVRDFLHVDDVLVAMGRAAMYEGPERIFNIGSGEGVSINQLIEDIEQMQGHRIEVRRHPGRDSDVPRSILDINRARRELDWSPEVTWKSGLKDTMSWIKEHVPEQSEA
ncbi:MAG: NAD-dependent epimerase/dehydratase family protein [Phycisphaerales bacterium]|nr:NAD-dependent epimerase/dehydratase family protein [Phycisphaerales bacterium]